MTWSRLTCWCGERLKECLKKSIANTVLAPLLVDLANVPPLQLIHHRLHEIANNVCTVHAC